MNGAQAAVDAIGGNMSELARRLEVKPQAVQNWVRRGAIPARRALQVHQVTGVALHVLNPAVYPSAGNAA